MTTQTIATKPTAGLSATTSDSSNATGFSRIRAARIAGVSYLLLFALAMFGNFIVVEGMVEPGDAAATVANITESLGTFRLGIIAFLVIFVLDIVVAWALHIVFRDVNRDVSLVTAWSRLVYTVMLGVALVSLFEVLQLVNGSEFLAALGSGQVNADVMTAMASFESAWLIGLAAFGLHLIILGGLVIRSGYVTRVLGWLLIAAGTAYMVDTVAHTMIADYESMADMFLAIVAVPSVIGEGWLGLWLLRTRKLAA